MMGEFCGFAFTLTGLFAFLGEIITVLAAMYQFFLSLLCIFFAMAGSASSFTRALLLSELSFSAILDFSTQRLHELGPGIVKFFRLSSAQQCLPLCTAHPKSCTIRRVTKIQLQIWPVEVKSR